MKKSDAYERAVSVRSRYVSGMSYKDIAKEEGVTEQYIRRIVSGKRGPNSPNASPTIVHGFARRGKNRAPEYRSWAGMISRCHDPNTKLYSYYGARGICVHPDWMGPNGFQNFLTHIGLRPGPGFSVDRKENNNGYEPGNVRWATRSEQMFNTRKSIWVEMNGEKLPLKVWCNQLGVKYQAVHLRIRRGMDPISALTKPFDRKVQS